ncbi:hypothetical protein Clacol_000333 [Clathrus columnatus]|uniref:Glycoside hydrolase family 92 protein n=1 Tax=Clathrus columnatus TaxID=1419009 RepID=A0AAV5A0D7_9AGAM|nr:hypothetical protein Clacol_000333 [Clathrus columnatus]
MAWLDYLCLILLSTSLSVYAQPNPAQQKRISAAIKNAAHNKTIDWTQFVNPFIGTDNFGDVCPGASVPFGMAKFTVDMTGYAPAGYVVDPTQQVRGLSPLHDSGTGSYGNFEIMPMFCPGGFDTCLTKVEDRLRFRQPDTDDASPGYFTTTLNNSIKLEATSTRRAGLERFTFPKESPKPYFVLDLSNDLPNSFSGGVMDIDPIAGRITLGGKWEPRQAFACYDILDNGKQELSEYGVWTADIYNLDAKGLGLTHLNLTKNLIGGNPYESGALFSYANNPTEINIRVGVSFVSAQQACENAESEIGNSTFEEIRQLSVDLWNAKLSKLEIDVGNTVPNVTEMLYSSVYRSFLTPNNATGEGQGLFANTASPYFDSLYCSWDTFRTFYPWMSLHSPQDFADIVENYIDGWRKNGWLPECHSNNLPGWTQGGSNGVPILADFAVKYHNEAQSLGVDLDELYSALVTDGQVNPPEWNIEGRQINVYKQYGYVPTDVLDTSSTGMQTREGSRTLEYSFNDFGTRQVAQLLGKAGDESYYANRSLSYRNVWDPDVTSDGFKGFMQKRFPNGSFEYSNPIDCSPLDTDENRSCSLQRDNVNGFYESSSWEYSFFAPHDVAHLVELMGGSTPIGYHYADQPAKSIDQVRDVVFTNFGIEPAGLPGNDDQCAMGTWLIFHLLGLYPVPSTTQYLVLSPFLPTYTIHNTELGTSTTVTVEGFDPSSVAPTIPKGASAYVKSVFINGAASASNCHIDFYDTFRVGGNITIQLTSNKSEANDCGGSLPDSLSTGGWANAR